MQQATCPYCHAPLEHDGSLLGQEVVCPNCTGIFRVGASAAPSSGRGAAPGPSSLAAQRPSPTTMPSVPGDPHPDPTPGAWQADPIATRPTSPPAEQPALRGPAAPPLQNMNPMPVIDSTSVGQGGGRAPGDRDGAEGTPGAGGGNPRLLIYGLVGLVLFMLGLIGAVTAGRYVRQQRSSQPAAVEKTHEEWIVQLSEGEDETARNEAAEALLAAGSETVAAALAAITEVRDDGNVFNISPPAVKALAALGESAAEPLSEALSSEDEEVRAGAAFVFREMGAGARPAVDALAKAAGDPSRRVRWYAIDALAAVGPDAAPAVDALVPMLEHEGRLTRRRAVTALGRIGPKAMAALPAVTKLVETETDSSIRQQAELAVRQINLEAIVQESIADAPDEVKRLVAQLREDDQHRSVAAAKALGTMGRGAAESVPALAQALLRENKWIREASAQALGEMGRDGRPYSSALRPLLDDPEPEVRLAAETALAKLEGG